MESHLKSHLNSAIFGGTFDPIHNGHINLLVQIKEKLGLDEVILVPTALSPFKENEPPLVSNAHRKAMAKLVCDEIPFLTLCDFEIEKEGVCYTVDTLRHLHEKEGKLFLILAEDAAKDFFKWKDVEECLTLAEPVVGCRTLNKNFNDKLKRVDIDVMEISSTAIRSRIKKDLYCGHLLPKVVLDYIHENKLYY